MSVKQDPVLADQAPGDAPGADWVVQGWCPGARRPMMAADGLVARVRPTLSRISPAQLSALADLAETHGSGVVEATARANLQVRGLSAEGHAALLAGLAPLGLLDPDAEAEARRNVVLTPFPGAAAAEVDAIASALCAALTAADAPRLPGKFGFLVDCGPQRRLSGISGDIRIERDDAGALMVRADGTETGTPAANAADAARIALSLAEWFVASGGVGADGRGRMRRHLAAGAVPPPGLTGTEAPAEAAPDPAPGLHGETLLLAAAFGQFPSHALRAIAAACPEDAAIGVTPFRMLALPLSTLPAALASEAPLIHDPADPLLRVSCCTGAPGCPQAAAPTRALAAALAPQVPPGRTLHVSGCAKGCAHPGPADTTLTARGGLFDLVRDGRAWDEPTRRALRPEDLTDTLF
ncbi:precorrin-3B synthase [Rhodovulum sp. DZ06]|uniref:precorrin-3B synthase n=1 Tax=Rhodovulum sp. DZ06 TaxID=3425126 RepID=UPI003D342A2A